jgi:carboxymethylenebutenolidase
LLKESPKFKVEKVATWGWCMGGGLSLQAALQVKGLDAAVIYYGPVELDRDRLAKLTVPLCGHFAMRDDWVTPVSVQQLDGLLAELDKPHEFHYYDAVHAFANPSNAKYDKAKAAEAWSVSLAFLRRTFAEPPRKPNVIDRIEKIFQ